MPPPNKPSRGFSFFGFASSSSASRESPNEVDPLPQLKLEADRQVYRPGDLVTITIEIKNPANQWSFLIENLSLEIKGIEKLDNQWFSTPKPSHDSKQRRGGIILKSWSWNM